MGWHELFNNARADDFVPYTFMYGSTLRSDLWFMLKECAHVEEIRPVHEPRITANQIVERLSALIAKQPDSSDKNLPKRAWSSSAEHQVILPDLSAEISRT